MRSWRSRHVRVYLGPDERHEEPAPWELFHESSKVRRPRPRPAGDRLAERAAAAQEEGVAAVYQQTAESYRSFPNAPRVALPLATRPAPTASLDEIVRARRSLARFAPAAIGLDELAWLLALSSGVTAVGGHGKLFRAAPAAGGLFELETYVAAARVDGLPRGLYHYDVQSHALERLRGGDAVDALAAASVYPEATGGAAAILAYTSVLGRLLWKYEHRSYRHTLLDAGHLAENVALAAAARGLAACPFGGFIDDEAAAALGVDGVSELPLHMVLVGRAADGLRPALAAAPRLRRLDALRPPPGVSHWRDVDRLLREAMAARGAAARRLLVQCAAILPADATVHELAGAAAPPALSPRAAFWFPPGWPEARRAAWIAAAEAELDRALAWLELPEAPTVLVDLTAPAAVPATLNRDRLLVRKIVWPAGLDVEQARDQLAHELVHACCLPHHRFFAEGLAGAASTTPEELAEVDRELAAGAAPPVDVARLLEEPGTVDGEHLLAGAAAASFVAHLARAHGKAPLFAFVERILYPAPPPVLRAAGAAFREAFGVSCADAGRAWWAEVRR